MKKTTDQLLGELYDIIAYKELKTAYLVLKSTFPKKRSFASLSNEELECIIPKIKEAYRESTSQRLPKKVD